MSDCREFMLHRFPLVFPTGSYRFIRRGDAACEEKGCCADDGEQLHTERMVFEVFIQG